MALDAHSRATITWRREGGKRVGIVDGPASAATSPLIDGRSLL
jgi:hypothetical protein